MSRPSVWATKVAALVQGGNVDAAIAQIKVAPTVRDLEQLRAALTKANVLQRHRHLDETLASEHAALSAPRLHRSP